VPIIREVQRAGANTLREIAESLNARGINAPRRAMARHFRQERAGKRVSSTQSPFSSVGIVSVILMPSSFASRPSSANSSASVAASALSPLFISPDHAAQFSVCVFL
jgi:hypothetical protein